MNERARLESKLKEQNGSKLKVGYQSPQSGRRSGLSYTEKRYVKRSKHLA
jgi:hypothetical protein